MSASRGLAALRGLSRRGAAGVQPVRGGGGGPVPSGRVATEALPEQDEWIWDDGTFNPEPCMDVNNTVSTGTAAALLAGGFGVFYSVYKLAAYCDKPSFEPTVRREFPYDNLKEELGGDNGLESCVKYH
eukprot:CAMPEP_0177755666 /NCGR_PEP_ID=MMETSP0491_2-20121128/2689_1 /TAXON_ID=63592 /ORGANISM="Tetraselmis chuii, Strain PLY429" /LENGTH=128 /DNA_ID=CAMNT_0019271181 /DNA_START=98 /DNA_END=484 /DNA_ORIENTATION=+